MAKKGQKFKKQTQEIIDKVLEYKQNNSYKATADKFGISINTIKVWKRKGNNINIRKTRGRKKTPTASIEEKYEILKKFIDFLGKDQNKK